MNSWKCIWESYYVSAKTRKLLIEAIKSSSVFDRLYLGFTFFGMGMSGWLHFNGCSLSLLLLAVSEVGFLLKLRKLKDDLVINEYGDPGTTQAPPDRDNHKDSRYLVFKKALKEKTLHASHVEDCMSLVDLKIDMASTEGMRLKSFNSLALGVAIGFLGAIWQNLSFENLALIGLLILVIGLVVVPIITFFPTRIEQLKEMKYFMALYCRELQ